MRERKKKIQEYRRAFGAFIRMDRKRKGKDEENDILL